VANITHLSSALSIEAAPAGASATAPSIGRLSAPRTRWWVEVAAIVWLCWVYDAVTNLAPLRLQSAIAHGSSILRLEQSLGVAPEHSLDRWLASHHSIGVALSYYYDNAHFIVTLAILGWLWWRRSDIYRPLRSTLVLVNLLAFVVFWLYPVAPPRMLSGFTDVVATSHTIGSWHTGALASDANQLAAMPSLHIAWAVWCTAAVWIATSRVWVRLLAALYPFLTAFAVLSTGNHYVLDMVGGLAVLALAGLIVAAYERRRSPSAAVRGLPAG
jgi:membrane-associated phospholipid phosphatase